MDDDQFRRLLEHLAESTPDVLYMVSADWQELVYVNDAFEELYGLSIEELEDEPGNFVEGIHPDDRDDVQAALARVREGEAIELEYRVNAEENYGRWVWARGEPIRDDGEVRWIGGFVRDVTDRHEREAEAQRTRQRLRQIINLVPDLIFAKNVDGEFLLVNEALAEAYGRPVDEIEGKTDHELVEDPAQADQFRADDLEVIESGDPKYIPEEELTTVDGETLILETRKIPFEVADTGEPAVLGYARDVTTLTEYERELTAQRDRLELLNTVVRHDIRNDMQIVRGRAELLEDHVDEAGREHLDALLRSATEAIERTRTARDLTRTMLREGEETTAIALERVLTTQVEAIRSRYHEAEIVVDRPIPAVDVDADQLLESVLDNLFKNAIEHTDAETPRIEVSADHDADTAVVRVADNGPGIPEHVREAVLEEELARLDDAGTGLGLRLVRTVVDQYGGEVRIEDNEPEGSVVEIELQLVE